jgi:riboflavin biosynthesis pyrimidine reductase
MPKISITKKTVWSLILKVNRSYPCIKKNILNINENIGKTNIMISYDLKNNSIKESNILINEDNIRLFKIFFPIISNRKKNQYIAHIAQSLDGYIATQSGESKYISGKENLEHIHMLRAISDFIIVGANTYIEDKPKLTTRLVKGNSPKIFIFDPKKVIKKKDLISNATILAGNLKLLSDELKLRKKTLIYIEGGGKTISYFIKKNLLDRLHVCLCPIILGGGRPSFIENKYIKIPDLKSYRPCHYIMGKDILFDININ